MKNEIFNWGNLSKYRNELYGFSALWVILYHIFKSFKKINFNWTIVFIGSMGNVGVDIFLLMAGICSYFSIKKSQNFKEFFKKRIIKILKVYMLFCIPCMIFKYAIIEKNYNVLFHEIFFLGKGLNMFWFIICILICYFIYPIIYKFLQEKKYKTIIAGLGIYIIFLFLFLTFNKTLFDSYEICLLRIPIFVGGGLLGPLVFERKPIKQNIYLFFLIFLLSYGPLVYFINSIPILKMYLPIYSRFYLGGASLGVIFVLNIIFELFDLKNIRRFLRYLSGFTLEIYVTHIVLLYVLQELFEFTKVSTIFIFSIIFIIVSIIAARLLNIILSYIKLPKNNKLIKQ